MSRFIAALAALCLIGWTMTAAAAGLVDTVQLVSSSAAAANAAPPAQTFTVSQAGSYSVTLDDLQLPVGLASLNLAIVNSTTAAVILTAAGAQTGTTVSLAVGTYTVQVLATAASGAVGGTFSVQVAPAGGGAAVFQYEDTVGPAATAPNTGQSGVATQFSVSSAGTYQLTATDLAFPVVLTSLSVGVFVHCGTTPGCTPTPVYTTTAGSAPPFSASLSLVAGTYDLFMVAKADPTALQGLFSVQIAGGGATLYGTTQAVGNLSAPASIAIPAAGPVSLKLADLAVPAGLASLKAIVAQNGSVLDQVASAGSSSFTAAQGAAQLYVAATPGGGGQGAYEAWLTSGAQTLADIAQPVLSTSSFGYAFSTTLATGGVYQVSVNDFQKPVPLGSLMAITAQQGTVLGSTQSNANFNAAAGQLNIVAFPTVASSTSEGLFSVTIAGPGSSATAYQTTQGVGALFSSQTVTVPSGGSYDLTLTDFAFPAGFSNLALIATSGNTVAGSIFNTGQLQLSLTSGTYVLSVLAQVGPSANYGLYGLNLAPAPPAPTVTFTASASSVASGQSATLTWSSTDATSCTASGAWNGALTTAGSQSTGALTESSSFTLTCAGGGGTATATVKVAVSTAATGGGKSGGGGALSPAALLTLVVLLVWISRRRMGHTSQP
jgi:hypothetical protein